jgi:alanine-synthesizing transaminase
MTPTFSDRTNWDLEENRLTRTLSQLRLGNRQIFDLTRSNPTECAFQYDAAKIEQAFKQPEALRYHPEPRGLQRALEAVCGYYAARQADVAPEDLVLTSGTSEAYSFLFRLLCNPGDEVLIPAPSYPLFDFLADLCDVRLVRFPLIYDHGWQIDFPALAAAATQRSRAVIVVYPNNPTGHFVSAEEQKQLSELCRDRGLALIADEVFLDFSLQPNQAFPSFSRSNEVLTFTLSGLSKICGLPQMKLAWIAANGPAQEKREALARLEVIADSYLSVGTPVQLAAPILLETRTGFHNQVMSRIVGNLRELDAQLSRQSGCGRLQFEGGWTAILRVPALQTDEDLAVALLRQRSVNVHPGHFYDFAQPGHLVVSLIVPENEFSEGIRRILAHFA